LDKRHLQIRVAGEEVIHRVEHNHFKGWPDFEVPFDQSLSAFKGVIEEASDFIIHSD